jgi:hypothetical protein
VGVFDLLKIYTLSNPSNHFNTRVSKPIKMSLVGREIEMIHIEKISSLFKIEYRTNSFP